MAKKTIYLSGILLTILIGTFLHWKLCCGTCTIANTKTEQKLETDKIIVLDEKAKVTIITNPIVIKDSTGDFEFKSNENFNFNISGFSILEPISEDLQNGVEKLKLYLESNPSKFANIIGYYSSNDTNDSAFPNLGIARANAIKNYLVSKGIPSKQINTSGDLKNDLIVNDTIYVGPFTFNINTVDDTSSNSEVEELKALADKIKANPIVLYFSSGQAKINLSTEQRQQIDDLSKYLDKVEDASCLIIGHTDNTGKKATNIKLGQGRADFTKNYLIQNGISADKIKTASEGSNSPIASNKTKEGRAKNRRTVITIN